MSAAAGWYADPTDAASVRWWDGERWTADTRPAPQVQAAGAAVVAAQPAAPEPVAPRPPAPQPVAAEPLPEPVVATAPVVEYERELVGAGVGASGASLTSSAIYATAPAATDVGPTPLLEPLHAPPAPAPAFMATTTVEQPAQHVASPVPSLAPAPVSPASAPVLHPVAVPAFTPEAEPEIDRSRPGAPIPAQLPPHVNHTAALGAYAQPLDASAAASPAGSTAAAVRPGFAGAPLGGAAAFHVMSSSGGWPGENPAAGHANPYAQPSHWKRTLVILGMVLAVIAGAAAIGVPRFLDSKAAAAAATAPQIVKAKAPTTYAGARRSAAATTPLSALSGRLTGDGAAWTWTQGFRTADATTLVLGGQLGATDRALAYRALTDHAKAMDLVNAVVADVSAGTRDVPGQPVQYATPVGGSMWCLPYASDGIGGGLCVWTNGGQILVSRTLPGVAESAAHSMLTQLATLAKLASKSAS